MTKVEFQKACLEAEFNGNYAGRRSVGETFL